MIKLKRVTAMLAAFLAVVGFILPMPASAAAIELHCWHSNQYWIGKWQEDPTVYYYKSANILDEITDIPFDAGIGNAKAVWNEALGTSISISSWNSSAEIRYCATTREEFLRLYDNTSVDDDYRGLTIYNDKTWFGSSYYDGNKSEYYLWDVEAFVFQDDSWSYMNYMKTIAHELGHSMGWYGHPFYGGTNWVMSSGQYTTTSLKPLERDHLRQIYRPEEYGS